MKFSQNNRKCKKRKHTSTVVIISFIRKVSPNSEKIVFTARRAIELNAYELAASPNWKIVNKIWRINFNSFFPSYNIHYLIHWIYWSRNDKTVKRFRLKQYIKFLFPKQPVTKSEIQVKQRIKFLLFLNDSKLSNSNDQWNQSN